MPIMKMYSRGTQNLTHKLIRKGAGRWIRTESTRS